MVCHDPDQRSFAEDQGHLKSTGPWATLLTRVIAFTHLKHISILASSCGVNKESTLHKDLFIIGQIVHVALYSRRGFKKKILH